ncbi:1657_t:CDS:2 [Rhizophagus irregularis]|nr:1657_t:CDS:2 [Rhizophagus irregularis]
MNIIKSDEEGRREMRNIFSIGIKRQVKIVFVEIQSRNKWRGGDLLVFHHSSLLAEPQNQWAGDFLVLLWENSKSRWVKDINFSILPSEGTRLLDPATESERSAQFNNESFNVGGSKRNLERDHEKRHFSAAGYIPNIPDQYYKDGYTTPFLRSPALNNSP